MRSQSRYSHGRTATVRAVHFASNSVTSICRPANLIELETMLEFEDHMQACRLCALHQAMGLRGPHLRSTGRRAGERVSERLAGGYGRHVLSVARRTATPVFVEVPAHLAAARKLLDIPAGRDHRSMEYECDYEIARNSQRMERALGKLEIVDWPSEREVAGIRVLKRAYEGRAPRTPRWLGEDERRETGSAKRCNREEVPTVIRP